MVMSVHRRTILGLPFLTGFFAGVAYPLGGFGLVYQLLPASGSGFDLLVCHLYQLLPPPDRRLTTDSHMHDTVAGWAGWTRVITVDNVENGRHTQNV